MTSRFPRLPITPPYPPMEALSVERLPAGEGWLFEPKWDGFRCLAFRDGNEIELQSKAGQPLARYFPEVVEHLRGLPQRFVLDGELVVPVEGKLSFDDLLQRIHPAPSRIARLARERPAVFIVFDLLVDDRGRALLEQPLSERRRRLESFAAEFPAGEDLRLSPATTEPGRAREWLASAGADLDGVVAKRLDLGYQSGTRTGMQKVKRLRTADCVVGGFRYAAAGDRTAVGSLLLGLYDDEGLLHHVGFTSGFKTAERPALLSKLLPLVKEPGFTGKTPGGPSRWSTERSAEWVPLKPKLVVEVRYDHFTGGRFRHGTKILRWRPDKAPAQCLLTQVLSKASARSGNQLQT